jgi:hypothetical protein
MSDNTKVAILSAMLKMHQELAEYCGDLDVSLKSIEEIAQNTESWYVIFDSGSTRQIRGVRYHYKANWETSHGVEVVVINGNQVRFVGNCGYFSSLEGLMNGDDDEFNYIEITEPSLATE